MTADAFLHFVGADNHGHRVPTDQTFDSALHLLTSGKGRLLAYRNRILIRSGRGKREIYSRSPARMELKLLQKPPGTLRSACSQDIIKRVQPLAGFKYFQAVVVVIITARRGRGLLRF